MCETSTVIPVNDKPRRDPLLATTTRKTLEDLDIQAPKANPDVFKVVFK